MNPYIPIAHHWYGFYIVGAWILLLLLLGRISDWARLGQRFAASKAQCENAYWTGWQSGRINAVPYWKCLWLAVTEEGILLRTGPDILLRPGHPPIFIPWQAITHQETHGALALMHLASEEPNEKLRIAIPARLIPPSAASTKAVAANTVDSHRRSTAR